MPPRSTRQTHRPRTGRAFWQQFDPAQIPRVLARLRAMLKRPCLLCRARRATTAALFQPDDPRLWGGRADKLRLVPYGLCARCLAIPAAQRVEAVEARLRQVLDLARRRN